MIPSEALERFARARIGHLATVRKDGSPHLFPFAFVLQGDSLYAAIDEQTMTGQNAIRAEEIRRDPRVSVLVDHYEEDWNRTWWVRAEGLARVVDDGDDRTRVLGILAGKYEQYEREEPSGPAIVIDVKRWSYWPK
jgi:PPOX class probable F420-dependent enzyme